MSEDIGLDEIQSTYLGVLRAQAFRWPAEVTPADTNLALPQWESYGLSAGETGHGKLLVWIDICADNVALLTAGAYLDGPNVRADKLHNQLFTLPDKPTSLALNVTGTPAELAQQTAAWFETLLRRPIVRQEWLDHGQVHARRWLFFDTGEPLVEGGRRTGDLGPPDRTVQVRGDRR